MVWNSLKSRKLILCWGVCWGLCAILTLGWVCPAGATIGSTIRQFGPIKDLAAGSAHVCVVNKAGRVYCWGDNSKGQTNTPHGLGITQSLIAYGEYTCALNNGGQVHCWGDRQYPFGTPRGLSHITGIWLSDTYWVCAISSTRQLTCWDPRDPSPSVNYPNPPYLSASIPDSIGAVKEVSSVYYNSNPDNSSQCLLNKDHDWYCLKGQPTASWTLQPGKLRHISSYCVITLEGQADCASDYVGSIRIPSNTRVFADYSWILPWGGWAYCAWGEYSSMICSGSGPLASQQPKLINVRKMVVGMGGEMVFNLPAHMDEPDYSSIRWFACAIAAGDFVRCWGTQEKGVLGPLPQNNVLADSKIILEHGLAWPWKAYDIKHSWHNQASSIMYYWQQNYKHAWKRLHTQHTELRLHRYMVGSQIRFCGTTSNSLGRSTICSNPSRPIRRSDLR